jgi:hypothetical protein
LPRYEIHCAQLDDRPKNGAFWTLVAEVGSVAGLGSAAATVGTSIVSVAYPHDVAWLTAWAREPVPRRLLVHDRVHARAYRLDVLDVRDTSGEGLVFELQVGSVSALCADPDVLLEASRRPTARLERPLPAD